MSHGTCKRMGGVVLVVVLLLALGSAEAQLQVGTAAVKITPPTGMPMAGYYHARGVEDVIDDLYAKAAVLDDGSIKIALVVCDIISLPRKTVLEARRLAEQQAGVPGAHIMISATHTHTGPALARDSVRDNQDGGSSDPAVAYTAELPRRIAQAVKEANDRLTPAKASYARESEPRLAFCRRFWMKDGTVGWNPGKRNPNVIRPVSSIDPEVGVVYVETLENKPLLTYVNFALHPDTVGGVRISADYPGVLARRLADYRGPEMMTLFANGTCGNLNHINVNWSGPQKGPEEAARLGTILAGAVCKAYMDLQPVKDTTLRAQSEVLQLPTAPISPEDIEEARAIVARKDKARFMEQVQAYKVLDIEKRRGEPLEVEVQVITMGDALAWVSLPGEIFVELGLSIKAASPFAQTHIAELANGSIGYIPNRSAYAEGNYEVVSARCAAGSGEMCVQAAITMLEQLKPQSR